MTKKQMQELIEDMNKDMTAAFEEIIEKKCEIAYLEGILNGMGIKKKAPKPPLKTSHPGKPDEELMKTLEADYDPDCRGCQSSEMIEKWSKKTGIKVDKGDSSDN